MIKVLMPPPLGHGAEFYANFLRRGFGLTKGITFELDKRLLAFVHEAPGFEGKAVIPIEVQDEDRTTRAWYDFADFPHDVRTEVMGEGDIYLKMNLRPEDASRPGLFPIGIACGPHLLDNLTELRSLRARGGRRYAVIALLRTTNYQARVQAARAAKGVKPPKGKTCLIGLTGRDNRPAVPPDLWGPKLTALEYCRAVAQADLNVTAPGIGPWTWRHTETFAIGTALVAPVLTVVQAAPTAGTFIEVKPDFSDGTAIMQDWLERPADRKTVEEAGRDYYAPHLKPEAIAAYIIRLGREAMERQGTIGPSRDGRRCPECGAPLFEKRACCSWKKLGWKTILRCSAIRSCDFMEGLDGPPGQGEQDAGKV